MREITIRVEPRAAAIYLSASDPERRKLDALLSLLLTEVAGQNRPLQEIIRDASREAAENGLTPEILQEILGDESIRKLSQRDASPRRRDSVHQFVLANCWLPSTSLDHVPELR